MAVNLPLFVSEDVEKKITERHGVTVRDVEQCFENLEADFCTDDRPEHKTDPPTEWFVAPTNQGRRLKIVFVFENGTFYLKTAHEANPAQIARYEREMKRK